jgi:addiction module HigA family antidote
MLEKYNLNPFKLSKDIQLSQSAVRMITIGKTKITTPVAMRLAKYFNTNPDFWLAMQMKWDLAEAAKDKALMKVVKSIPRVKKGPAPAKKTATKKRAAKPKKAAGKRGRKPAAAKAKPGRAVQRGRKPAATRAKPKKAVKRGRKPAAGKAKRTGKRGRPAKKR